METTVKKTNETEKALFIAFSSAFCIIGLLSFIFHVSPKKMLDALADFEQHHYFLISFFSVLLSVFMLKLYFGASESKTVTFIKKVIAEAKAHNNMFQKDQHIDNRSAKVLHAVRIDKSAIAECKFDIKETLCESELIHKRRADLEQAVKLGNLYKQKVNIYFQDSEGLKQTYTTVWQADNENICLKGGTIIPVKSIYKVNFI